MKNFTGFRRSIKSRVSSALALILIGSFFTFNLDAQTNGRRKNPLKDIKDARAEKGAKVGNRVKELRAANKAVNAALQAFEQKGHKPKFDEAFSFAGKIERPRPVALRKSHHASPQTSIYGDGVEIIFVTVVELYNEWQGTTITNFYDAYGVLEEQYVANVVITRSEYNPYQWTANFELKYESDGIGYLNHQPGMFTNFVLGTPILQQSVPLTLDPSQFASTEQMNSYYDLYPNQYLIDYPGGGDGGDGGIQPIQQQQARLVKRAHAAKPQTPASPLLSPWRVSGWSGMARDVGIGSSFAAGACSVGVLLGGISAAGCLGVGVTLVTLNAARNNLRVYRRW